MIKRVLSFLFGVLATLLALEAVMHVLPVSTATNSDYHVNPLIVTYPAHHCFQLSTGWDLKNAQRICANNFGFVADHDFARNPAAVALIGDSFVEGNMLPTDKRIGHALESHLGGQTVYALGGPGSNLLDYAIRAKFAVDRFGSRIFVFVLERNDIKESLCGSGQIHGRCLDPRSQQVVDRTMPPAGTLKRWLRHSELAQYLVSQLKLTPAALLPKRQIWGAMAAPGKKAGMSAAQQEQILDEFFREIFALHGARYVFAIDPDRARLFETETAPDPLAEALRGAGQGRIEIVDLRPAFRQYVTKTHRSLAVGPYDGHWNADAMDIVAAQVAAQLKAGERPGHAR